MSAQTDNSEVLDEVHELKILGRAIGTFTGWDESDTLIFIHYNVEFRLELTTKVNLSSCDSLTVNFDSGLFECWCEGDEVPAASGDLIALLKDLPIIAEAPPPAAIEEGA